MNVIDIANLKAIHKVGVLLDREARNALQRSHYDYDKDSDENKEAHRTAKLARDAAKDDLARATLLGFDADIEAATRRLAKAKKAYRKTRVPIAYQRSRHDWNEANQKLHGIQKIVGALGLGLRSLDSASKRTEQRAVDLGLTTAERLDAWEAGLDKLDLAYGFRIGVALSEMLEAVKIAAFDDYIEARLTNTHSQVMEIIGLGYPLVTYNGERRHNSHGEIVSRVTAGLASLSTPQD